MAYKIPVFTNLDRLFIASIDMTTTGNYEFLTVPLGKTYIPIRLFIELTNVSGLISVSTVSLGTNSPNYNNMIGETLLTGLNTVNESFNIQPTNSTFLPHNEETIFLRISGVAVATTYLGTAHLLGANF